jgi:hypothetical protein
MASALVFNSRSRIAKSHLAENQDVRLGRSGTSHRAPAAFERERDFSGIERGLLAEIARAPARLVGDDARY